MVKKGYKQTAEHTRKSAESRKSMIFTEEHRKNLSLSHLGKKQSPETIKKRADANRGKKRSPEFCEQMRQLNLGTKASEEARKNISEGHKGIKQSEEHKAKKSASLKRYYINNPEAKLRRNEKLKGHPVSQKTIDSIRMRFSGKKTEEHKQKLRDSWKDPESLKRRMDNNKHFYNTEPELIMKQILTDLNLNYFQQYIPKDIDHPYLTDFYLPEYNTVIECDGDVFHAHPSLFKPDDIIPRKKVTARFIRERDANRTRELRDKGYIVLRFWECDLKNNPEEVILHLQSLKSDGC